jgi:hypothetical protein
MYDSWSIRKQGFVISETVSIINIHQLSYIILLDNRRKQGFVISDTVSIVNILQLSYDSWSMFTIVNVSLMTKPCFPLFSKRIMYDSWSMFTILNVSLMTKPCFLLLPRRIMYD